MADLTITIELTKEPNGTVKIDREIVGEGFMHYEIIGLLQSTCYELSESSRKLASELPTDAPVKLKFKPKSKK